MKQWESCTTRFDRIRYRKPVTSIDMHSADCAEYPNSKKSPTEKIPSNSSSLTSGSCRHARMQVYWLITRPTPPPDDVQLSVATTFLIRVCAEAVMDILDTRVALVIVTSLPLTAAVRPAFCAEVFKTLA